MTTNHPTIDTDAPLCEHHRDTGRLLLHDDPALPRAWRVGECPTCGYWAEVNVETGEVRAP